MNYQKFIVFTLSLFILNSCKNNNPEQKKPQESESVQTEKAEGKTPDTPKQLTMEDLSGHWEQNESQKVQGMNVSEKLSLDLKPNGDFVANISVMGVNSQSQGKWSLQDKTLSFSSLEKLVYHEDTKTLVNESKGIFLNKK